MSLLSPLNLPLFFLLLLPLSSSRSSPPDHLLLNCGASSPTTLSDLRRFLPDDFLSPSHSSITTISSSSSPNPLYSTARIFRKPSTYNFPISHPTPHLLRLHFLPSPHLNASHFHVLTSSSLLLRNLSFPSAASSSSPLILEFLLPPSSTPLSLSFLPLSPSNVAFVNAIELLSIPADLLPSSALKANLSTTHNTTLQTLFRINVGGPKITPFNDTLWRDWSPDSPFLSSPSSKSFHFSGRIQYQRYGATREIAPDHVYNTARVLTSGEPSTNMTWSFPATLDHSYLIRLHFCDIASRTLNELYFHIFLNGEMVYENFDISNASGELLAAPYYADFVAAPVGDGRVIVTIVPSNMSSEFRLRGLLNGLEIFKMSNSVGNLDGTVPAEVLLGSSCRGHDDSGTFAQFLLCAALFSTVMAAALMLVSKWKNGVAFSSSSLGWSALPMDAPEERFRYEILMTAGKIPDF